MTDYVLECTECGSYDEEAGRMTGIKQHRLNNEGSAETLAQIHRIKTGHEPVVKESGSDD